jgi:NAD(P)-dependent dehydrogenase (short-subunit alcohol dehydrogenase family)
MTATPMPDPAVWFVTGASSGFGREIVEEVLARGGCAVATARDSSRLAGLVALAPERALALPLDVVDPRQAQEAVRVAHERFGRIDVLVNNAGRGFAGAFEEASDAEVREVFELNVFGLMNVTRAVLPGMRARRAGAIVNLSSVGGLVARAGTAVYASTKFAVEGLSQAMAGELRHLGIRVMAVEPGPFRTNFIAAMPRAVRRIPDYDASSGARIEALYPGHGRQRGDPRRAAAAIVAAIAGGDPPMHLVLGAPALALVREARERFDRELEAWQTVARSADYPGEAD